MECLVLRAIAVLLALLTATSRAEFPSCYEDETAVLVVGVWDGTINEIKTVDRDTTIYCVAVDDLRTEEE